MFKSALKYKRGILLHIMWQLHAPTGGELKSSHYIYVEFINYNIFFS